ncbi:MAG: hypothetical protein CMM47_11735 [Rhodospirillaceae bacterium]|nr:hypothetical protein [Rhodospirillaceae bacterium]
MPRFAKRAGGRSDGWSVLAIGSSHHPPFGVLFLARADSASNRQRDDLERLAALIACLDIVVTVDTSICTVAAASGIPTIRLEASYMTLTSGRDAFFKNVFPCRDIDCAFDRTEALRRASEKYREWADRIQFSS